jgi:iron complex outermembrane recepter protein
MGLGGFTAGAAFAQPVENVVVTGVKTGQDDARSVSPTTNLDGASLTLSGNTTLEQVFQSLPSVNQGVGSTNSGGFGVYFVDLRSLNFNRTLTMVDGHRFVVSGIKTDEAVDLNNVPIALIDHIEILRSGSEPIFGADSVAGVVNVIMKHDFEGLSVTAYGGTTIHGDDSTGELTATWGKNFERGNVTINAGYFQRQPIAQRNRDRARNPITSAGYDSSGHIETTIGSPATPSGHVTSFDDTVDDLVLGSGRSRPFDPATDSYNFANVQDLQGRLKRETANLVAHYDITPSLKATLQVLASDRQSDFTLAPQSLGLNGTAKNPEGFIIPMDNVNNFIGQDVEMLRVLSEAGPIREHADGLTYRAMAGLEGTVDKFIWKLSYDHGNSRTVYNIRNSINLSKAIESVQPGCVTDPQCVPANYFGANSLSSKALNAIRYTDSTRSDYVEDVGEFSLNWPLADLGAGALNATLGGEWRVEHGYTNIDPVTLAGDQATPDSSSSRGGYSSREVYFDLGGPLLRDLPWVRSLDADIAWRYSNFTQFGGFTTWKASLSYAPDEQIRFRATTGIARRVPAITEAYGGITANFTSVQDPCDSQSGGLGNPVVAANCLAAGLPANFVQNSALTNIASGGGCVTRSQCDLIPETSRSLNLGLVLTPDFVPGLTATVDYYRYKIDNAIDSLADTDANFIPNTCYESVGLSSSLCRLIERTASGPNTGQINRILGLDENIGTIVTDGIDSQINYVQPLWFGPVLSVDLKSNLLFGYRVAQEGQTSQYAGGFASLVSVGGYPHLKSLLMTTLQQDNWTLGWRVHYIGGAQVLGQDPIQTPFAHAPAIWYHDFVASYVMDKTTVFTLGVDNVFNQKPPVLLDGITNSDFNTYDPDGTFIYFRVAHAIW